MDSLVTTLGTVGALFGAAAYFTNLITNGITLAWPTRPSWAAWAYSVGIGILMTLLLAAATLPLEAVWTRQTWAQVVLVGLAAGAGAAGANATQKKAEETRADAETVSNLRGRR